MSCSKPFIENVTQFKQTKSAEQKQAINLLCNTIFKLYAVIKCMVFHHIWAWAFLEQIFWLPELESALFDEPTVINWTACRCLIQAAQNSKTMPIFR